MIQELLKIASENKENEDKLEFIFSVLEKKGEYIDDLKDELEDLVGRVDEQLEKVGIDFSSIGKGIKDFAGRAAEGTPGKILGAGALGAASVIGSALIGDMYGAAKSALTRNRNYERMLDSDPELKDHPADKVKAYFNTLHEKGGPDMSGDPLIASGFVRQQLELNRPEFVYEGVHKLVQTRHNLEKSKPDFGFDISKLMGVGNRVPDQTTNTYNYNGPIGSTYKEAPSKGRNRY